MELSSEALGSFPKATGIQGQLRLHPETGCLKPLAFIVSIKASPGPWSQDLARVPASLFSCFSLPLIL